MAYAELIRVAMGILCSGPVSAAFIENDIFILFIGKRMKYIRVMMLAILWLCGSVAAQDALPYHFQFGGEEAVKGWAKTKGATLEPLADQLVIKGSNWDSKIYRRVELPAGRYCVYGEGSGQLQVMIQAADFKTPAISGMNLSSKDDKWKTDYRDFDLPAGQWVLVLQVPAASGEARVKWLKLEAAPAEVDAGDGIASPEELTKFRPSPAMVRGFMIGSNLKANDYDDLRQWGANVVRLQFNAPGHAKKIGQSLWQAWPSMLDHLENQILMARERGIKVVLDMHEPMTEKPQRDRDQWTDPEFEPNMIRAWKDIVTRFQKYSDTIWAYELWNEPLDRSQLPWAPRQWRGLAIKIVKEIRTIDKDCWIMYGPGPGSMWRGIENTRPLPDTHIIYTVHFYEPGAFNGQGIGSKLRAATDLTELTSKLNIHYPGVSRCSEGELMWDRARMEKSLRDVDYFANKWKVPMFVGEFSVVRWAPSPDGANWLRDAIEMFENRGWGWTYHAFREWPGWSLEHPSGPESFWAEGMPMEILLKKAEQETDRARVVKSFLKKNQNPS